MQNKTNTKKITSMALAFLLSASATVPAFASEDEKITVNLRVEGISKCMLNQTYEIDKNSSAAELIAMADELSENISVTGLENGYITEINGEKAGTFGGWDGWNYAVNGKSPSVSISDYILSSNDSVVMFYGDYPCFIPQINTEYLTSKGEIIFTTEKIDYDPIDFTPIISVVPLSDMKVVFNKTEYITDVNGKIKISLNDYEIGKHSLQVEKKSEYGAPVVLRYPADFSVEIFETAFGDINADLIVDVKDITTLQLNLVGLYDLIENQQYMLDVDKNNIIDVNDVTSLQLFLANNRG